MSKPSLLSGRGDLVVALVVMMISTLLIVPVPTVLLDLLITLNLSLSLLLLLVGLYIPNPLGLLSFPTLLLLSTLFRLGLNVASSRLILSQGDAGSVIAAFGSMLIRGELVVGIIIFTILTIVNFIVIARGASRVSEVAARFALDALPGKQMAIDADLRSGVVTPDEARLKREELRKESQLFASMDGAMRFVQGDAIAGVFIIIANISGGLYLGVRNGLSVGDAVETYSRLTIGDGLVTQIPALLVSICAGIVVTRVSSEENSTLGMDLGGQLFARPTVLYITAVIIGCLGALPGLPLTPFLVVAGTLVITAYLINSRRGETQLTSVPDSFSRAALPGPKTIDGEFDKEDGEQIFLYLEETTLYKTYRSGAVRFKAAWHEIQSDFFSEVGVHLPSLRVRSSGSLPPFGYSISKGGIELNSGVVPADGFLVETHPENSSMFGLKVLKEVAHPIHGHRIFWAQQSSVARRSLESAEVPFYEFFEYICLRAVQNLRREPEALISLTDVYSVVKSLEKRFPGLVEEVMQRSSFDTALFTELLQELLREGVSIREFKGILEMVALYCSAKRRSEEGETLSINISEVVEYIRMQRRKQLVSAFGTLGKPLKAVLLSEETETWFDKSSGQLLAASNESVRADAIFDRIEQSMNSFRHGALRGAVVLCRTELRAKVAKLLRDFGLDVVTLSFDELDPQLQVEQIAAW